jgi:hypothetical protein
MKTCINWDFFKNMKNETLKPHDHKDINLSKKKKTNILFTIN